MSPHDSGYDSSLQREYLNSTRYLRPNGVLMSEASREKLISVNEDGLQMVQLKHRSRTKGKSKSRDGSISPNVAGSAA